jgi:hypothetical protein
MGTPRIRGSRRELQHVCAWVVPRTRQVVRPCMMRKVRRGNTYGIDMHIHDRREALTGFFANQPIRVEISRGES